MEKTTKKAVFLGQEKQKQEKVRHCNRCTLSQFKTKKSGKYTHNKTIQKNKNRKYYYFLDKMSVARARS